mmetsp:Transcript_95227/g.218101  ORF Transcript_95227/g.218101 Transcript_95227/m.218101 type:complete len:261 (+) Transcript_95227:1442-2224(+)
MPGLAEPAQIAVSDCVENPAHPSLRDEPKLRRLDGSLGVVLHQIDSVPSQSQTLVLSIVGGLPATPRLHIMDKSSAELEHTLGRLTGVQLVARHLNSCHRITLPIVANKYGLHTLVLLKHLLAIALRAKIPPLLVLLQPHSGPAGQEKVREGPVLGVGHINTPILHVVHASCMSKQLRHFVVISDLQQGLKAVWPRRQQNHRRRILHFAWSPGQLQHKLGYTRVDLLVVELVVHSSTLTHILPPRSIQSIIDVRENQVGP